MQKLKDKNLIFLHLPKNGGNTLHSILKRKYNNKSIFSIKVIENIRLNTNEFINLTENERLKIKLLKGHMLFGLHQHLIGESKYITFLRNPEDRIISFYHYVKSRPKHRLYNFIHSNNYSLYDFVINVNEGDVHNAQIRWISGINGSEKEMFQKALKNIETHFSFVGFQEYFNESLILLSESYNWSTPYYKYQNKGSYAKNKDTLLDKKTKKAIAERNKGDLELYAILEKQFKKQLNECSQLNLKLKKLKLANSIYTNQYIESLQKLILRINKRFKV